MGRLSTTECTYLPTYLDYDDLVANLFLEEVERPEAP